jgi:hypothetical protein
LSESEEKNKKFLEHYSKIIVSLESLVRLVTRTKSNSSVSITLNVHGTLVSGKLVSVDNYHKYLTGTLLDTLEEKDNPELYNEIKVAFQALEEAPIIDENGDFILNYVCIQDARLYVSGDAPIFNVPYWIGKMESVDGFFVGETEEDPGRKSLV